MIGIYIITHKDSFKRYVGQSVDITKRLRRHWAALSQNNHENKHLQRAYNKYGRDAFSISTIECAEDLLTKIEQSMLNQWSNLYNICKIANVPPSRKGRPAWNKGKKGIPSGRKGIKHSDETKAKISAAKKGIKHSDETKAKMSAAKKGIPSGKKGIPSPHLGRKRSLVYQYAAEIKADFDAGMSVNALRKKYKAGDRTIKYILS